MKTTMKMSDLKYKDGFPNDIDRTKMVVVTVRRVGNSLLSYYSKCTKTVEMDWIGVEGRPLNEMYKEGIYIINPK